MITPVFGATGSGKTELVRRLIGRKPEQYRVVLVDDPNSQWTPANLKRAGVTNPDGSPIAPSALLRVGAIYQGPHKRLVRFPQLMPDDLVELAQLACSYHPRRDQESRPPDVAIVLDELRRACNSRGWVGGPRGPFSELLFCHRHFGIHLYACAQSPGIIDRHVVSNAGEVYLCRLQAKQDWEWVSETLSDDYLEAVRALPTTWPLKCVKWEPMKPPVVIDIESL